MNSRTGADVLIPVVIAGGSGTRLWPVSRPARPKPFIALRGNQTLFDQTLGRIDALDAASPVVVCNEAHRLLAVDAVRTRGVSDATILLEPEGRDTAAAIAIASLHAMSATGADPLLLVLPSDHVIPDVDGFRATVLKALPLAGQGNLVTFAIEPTRAETGFGYIEAGPALQPQGYRVRRFVEKPDRATATCFIRSGRYFWNSGMFLFRSSVFLSELERFRPDILACCLDSMGSVTGNVEAGLSLIRPDADRYRRCPQISVDRAVMEHTQRAAMVPLASEWFDIGSWSALHDAADLDDAGNAVRGDVQLRDVADCLIDAGPALVAGLGLRDLVVVVTDDAVLVADRNRSNEVSDLVQDGRIEDRAEFAERRRAGHVSRRNEVRGCGADEGIQRMVLRPGDRYSGPGNSTRTERWVVASGMATLCVHGTRHSVDEGGSIVVAPGQHIEVENAGETPLEVVRVRIGKI